MNEQIRFQDSKSLVFKVGQEEYGVHINQVVSIERMQNITPYPNRPAHVLGVTTIRGEVTPIVDVRSALSGVSLETNEATRIILVKAADKAIGLVVDAATDVLEITSDSIQQANLMESKDVSYLKGIAKIDDRLIILLDIEMLLQDTTNLDELREIIGAL